jgi:aflatoxin B1 aldehyde reductase
MYGSMYGKPSYFDALEKWEDLAEEEGVSRAEVAYRWVAWHSPLKRENGDKVICKSSVSFGGVVGHSC